MKTTLPLLVDLAADSGRQALRLSEREHPTVQRWDEPWDVLVSMACSFNITLDLRRALQDNCESLTKFFEVSEFMYCVRADFMSARFS